MRCEGFFCNRIELSGVRIALDGCVEQFGVKHLEPSAKPCQLPRSNCSMAFSMSSAVVMRGM